MKKRLLFLPLILLLSMSSCGPSDASSSVENSTSTTSTDGGGSSSTSTSTSSNSFNVTFYIDYSHSDEKNTYLKETYELNSKIARPADPECPDPAYPTFDGWSTRTQIRDEADLWDFDTVVTSNKDIVLYGIWNYREVDPKTNELTIYTFIPDEWNKTSIYAYAFTDEYTNNIWPGEVMSQSSDVDWLYSFTVDLDTYSYIIFNSGSEMYQTDDISLADASKDTPFFNIYTSSWGEIPEAKPSASTDDYATYTVTNLPEWIKNDNAVIFAWAWKDDNAGSWYETTYLSSTSISFNVLKSKGVNKCLLVRCVNGTTKPNWELTSGDTPGRIYNQTDDLSLSSSTISASNWKDYPISY